VNTVTHSYDISAVLSDILFDKVGQKTGNLFQVSTIFFSIFLCQNFKFKLLGGLNVSTNAKTIFDIRLLLISLKFPDTYFLCYPNIRSYIFFCTGADI
jgi:hypothetical protein